MVPGLAESQAINHRAWERHLELVKQPILEELHKYAPPQDSKEWRDSSLDGIIRHLGFIVQDIQFNIQTAGNVESLGRFIIALTIAVAGDAKIGAVREFGEDFAGLFKPGQRFHAAIEKIRESVRIEEKLLKDREIANIRKYAPARKYPQEMFDFFQSECDAQKGQKMAFDATAKKFGLDLSNFENFTRAFRYNRNKNRR
jgi:hypothetical protein